MTSKYEQFWNHNSYALIGHHQKRNFPVLTLTGLQNSGKTVYPVDASIAIVEGSKTFASLSDLPDTVEAAIIEVSKEDIVSSVQQVIEAGIKNLWIHRGTDTPEAIAAARKAGLNLYHGTCAVMYVNYTGLHKFHGWLNKLFKKY
ncbi:MAG: CoA-binding protein [Candidatus Marinimicrobia bacterium]|nr:CoA-binding protein [Candidatus Neomarinimicrobiota bacterium]